MNATVAVTVEARMKSDKNLLIFNMMQSWRKNSKETITVILTTAKKK